MGFWLLKLPMSRDCSQVKAARTSRSRWVGLGLGGRVSVMVRDRVWGSGTERVKVRVKCLVWVMVRDWVCF